MAARRRPLAAAAVPVAGGTTTGVGRFAEAVVELAPLAALAVVPLYFNPRTERVFEPDKLVWVIVLACLAGWGLLVAAAERRPPRWIARRPAPLVLAVAGLAMALGVGAALSTVPTVSLWGAYRRGQGLFATAALITLGMCVARTAGREAARARIRRTVVASVVPAALYALLQRAGIDSLEWNIYGTAPSERAFGPLGNPIFLGAYLAMVAPLAYATAATGWQARRRGEAGATADLVGGGLAACLAVAGLLASQSRGPLLGLAAGTALFGLLAVAGAGRRRLALGLIAGGGLAVAVAVALVSGTLGDGPVLPALGRMGELTTTSSRTAQERLLVWSALARAFHADGRRAVIGHGPETTAFVLPPHLPDALVRLAPVQVFDRAHNVVWEWWVSAGLVGVLALTGLYAVAFATGLRRLGLTGGSGRGAALGALAGAGVGALVPMLAGRPELAAAGLPFGLLAAVAWIAARGAGGAAPPEARPAAGEPSRRAPAESKRAGRDRRTLSAGSGDPDRWLVAAVLAGLAAHFVEGALGLPTAAGELVFWVYIGLLVAHARPTAEAGESEPVGPPHTHRGGPPLDRPEPVVDGWVEGLALATVLFAPILLPSAAASLRAWPVLLLVPAAWLAADVLGRGLHLRRLAARATVPAVLGLALGVVHLGPWAGGEIVAFAAVLALSTLAAAAHHARRAAAGAASEPWRWTAYAAAGLLAVLGAVWIGLRTAVADRHVRAGQEAALAGDAAGAAAHYARAMALWPQQPVYATYLVGALQRRVRDAASPEQDRAVAFEQARAALERAFAVAPDSQVATRLGVLYRDRGDLSAPAGDAGQWWRTAELHFARALDLQPNDPAALVETAGLLERIGQPAEARDAYRRAFDLHAGDYDAAAGAARVSLALGDVATAEAVLAAAVARDAPAVRRVADGGVSPPLDTLRAEQVRVMVLALTGEAAAARQLLDALAARADAGTDGATRALADWLDRPPASP
ncbi:hypothetical protein DCC79_04615 [bacterium]|nr:MAG: hypothetical protein DCC79_04615 [bacterium]